MTEAAARSGANRRLTARQVCHLTVHYRTGKQWHPAAAIDLSHRGCRLRLGEELEGGALIAVLFETPLKDGARVSSAEVRGNVTWCRLQGLSYQAGVLFVAPPEELHEVLAALS
jgi:hypothetical protein